MVEVIERPLSAPGDRTCWLIVMAKMPQAGRVKSRLASQAGVATATRFYRAHMLHTISRLEWEARWRTVLAVTPDAALYQPVWPRGVICLAQGNGDLGVRMDRVMRILPPGPVVLIGTDVPGITKSMIASAFDLLGDHDTVFGPAQDGGFWLVGMKRIPKMPYAFDAVRWSHPRTLADALNNLAGHRVAFIDTLSDIDTQADYRSARPKLGRIII